MSNLPDFSAHGYQAIKMLGSNSAGGRIVYLANDIASSQVVIKQFQFAKGAGWSGFKAIEREIKVLQDLNHKGIPRYLGSFETDDGYCIVQEYKSAHPLSESRHLSPDQIKQVGALYWRFWFICKATLR
jgi:serine/threonine protein kinase